MNVEIGDVLYFIEATEHECYHTKCRVCGGERKVTVNGVTFDCPMCRCEEEALLVSGYSVRHFRVCSIMVEMPTRNEWKASDARLTTYGLYRTSKGTWNGGSSKTLDKRNLDDKETNLSVDEMLGTFYTDKVVYSDYKLAVKVADALTAREIDKVVTFNEEHGTDFAPPAWNIKHDKKSK